MNTEQDKNTTESGQSELTDGLDVYEAIAKAKRRDLGRAAIAAFTALSLAKGMSIAAQSHEIAWSIAMMIGACFWTVGMWRWKELDD